MGLLERQEATPKIQLTKLMKNKGHSQSWWFVAIELSEVQNDAFLSNILFSLKGYLFTLESQN